MEITTIQIHENIKKQLDQLKEIKKETYEEIIVNLLKMAEKQKRKQEELLIEGCKEMAEDMLKINKELEVVDADADWEWNENGNQKR